MIRLGLNLTDEEFVTTPWTKTVINTNSPRQLDRPMSRGIIDFARHGQILVITPFCLAGAMAPITVAGALVLQHAEALAGITLAQIVRPGAPCVYGAFGSNVDMKSGAPAFGTPEHMQMTLGSGQLARHIGLPWRSAAGTAANLADAQAAGETQQSLWAALNANATMTFHAAGWLEGGLTFGYEKFINDIEALQSIAHMVKRPDMDQSALGYDAIEEVQPGGHFFAAAQTMQRYQTAFYPPLVADLANFGTWTENGSINAEDRATKIWQTILAEFKPPKGSEEREGRLLDYIARAREKGGVPIMD
jgi:trimethylamine--corrinoid protein Co-methyltransferase